MSAIDEILATGWYTDKRGRRWRRLPLSGRWSDQVIDHQGIHWAGQKIEADQMRLMIERDQHRNECVGLRDCLDHPVPNASVCGHEFAVFPAHSRVGEMKDDFASALDAARALAVES